MLIHCPTCLSPYDMDPDRAEMGDRTVRCDLCQDHWTVSDALRAAASDRPPAVRPEAAPVAGGRGGGVEIVTEARSGRHRSGPAGRERPRGASARRPRPGLPRTWAGWLCAAAVCLAAMGAIHEKEAVVRCFPPAAAAFARIGLPVNLRGLALADVRGTLTPGAAGPVLVLHGRISNLRSEPTAVPALRFAVRDKTGRELYSWTGPPPKATIDAGETMMFRTRLAAPPEAAQDLVVAFTGLPARQVAAAE